MVEWRPIARDLQRDSTPWEDEATWIVVDNQGQRVRGGGPYRLRPDDIADMLNSVSDPDGAPYTVAHLYNG